MNPSYKTKQKYLVDRFTFGRTQPKKGDVIVFCHPSLSCRMFLKRVVGVCNDRIHLKGGQIHVDVLPNDDYISVQETSSKQTIDVQWTLSDEEYFVLGDNLGTSLDSRRLGPIKRRWIIGKIWFRYWPLRI